MDISEVFMVRSAKGNDMLCVDSFLYYYDDRGLNTYRWSCNRRKDKIVPCRSRIITKLIENNESKHAVVKVFEEHSHGQCSPEEISKAFERKRLANLAGKPCTLEAKAEKRKSIRQDESIVSQTFSNSSQKKKCKVAETADWTLDRKQDRVVQVDEPCFGSVVTSFKKNNVYMLKTSHDRDMVCIDGYLYRLEGVANTSGTFRWECTRRRDDGCKARVQTDLMSSGRHALKKKRFEHNHPPFAQDKLIKIFNKQQERKQKELAQVIEDTEDFEEINCANSSKLLQDMLVPISADTSKEDLSHEYIGRGDASNVDTLETTEIEAALNEVLECENCDQRNADENNESKLDLQTEDDPRCDTGDDASNGDPLERNNSNIKTDLDLSKMSLLPSNKGNKILCIDNYLYHYDSRSYNKKKIYWTCVHRRDKFYNCRGRITTDTNIGSSMQIFKVSGQHMHANDVERIKTLLCNEFVSKVAKTTNMKPRDVLKSSIPEMDSGLMKEMVASSKDEIRRKISRFRYKMKQKSMPKVDRSKFMKPINDDDNDSISSLSSHFYSDDDELELPSLPMKLEQMQTNTHIEEESKIAFFDMNSVPEIELQPSKIEEHVFDESKPYKEEFEEIEHEYLRQTDGDGDIVSDMDLSIISTLRSAKGGELLCIDDFLYHVKSARDVRTYWECIKAKDKIIQCKSRVTTVMTSRGYAVQKVTNLHSHCANRAEVDKRILRIKAKSERLKKLKPKQPFFSSFNASNDYDSDSNEPHTSSKGNGKMRRNSGETRSVMKLYSVSDGPPSLAVRMTLAALKIPFELVNIDYCAAEHMTDEYSKINPQKEIPVLDDDGFFLSESVAIMQYLCDKYAPHSPLYPKDATKRALVNHRLCFNMAFYYASISAHAMAPIFFDYPRNEMSLKKVDNALAVFETYLERTKSKYAAGDKLTIADFPLVTATLCLEAIGFDLSSYPLLKQWYATFKRENPKLWAIGNEGMKEISEFEKNPPDLSHMNHPFHPTRKVD